MKKAIIFALALVLCLGLSIGADEWKPITPPASPSARDGHSMVTLPDGRVMMFGGEKADGELSNDLYAFESSNWSLITPNGGSPPKRSDHRAWVRGDQMYVNAGKGETGFLDDTWAYNTVLNQWNEIQINPDPFSGKIPTGRQGHTMTPASDGRVYLVGGENEQGFLSDVWVLENGTYRQITSAPYPYSYHSAHLAVNEQVLVLIGGKAAPVGMLSFYYIPSQSWGTIPDRAPPVGSHFSVIDSVDRNGDPITYTFGGYDSDNQESNRVYAFNVATTQWSQKESMPYPVANGSAAVLGTQQSSMSIPLSMATQTPDFEVFFFGGISNGAHIDSSMVFSVYFEQPPTVELIPYEPDPTNDFTPTLQWYPVSGATSYRVEIDDRDAFVTPLLDAAVVSGAAPVSGPCSYTPASSLPEGDIFWRVSSDLNYALFSTYDQFIIQADSDGDGVPDSLDAFPYDPTEWADSDGDGIGDNADSDDDNDGMPDLWEIQYGFDPLNDADAALDFDEDGFTNRLEFDSGTDPKDPGDHPVVLKGDVDGDSNVNLADAILAFKILTGIEPFPPVHRENDVNGDGKIGLPEIQYIFQILTGLREPGAEEFTYNDIVQHTFYILEEDFGCRYDLEFLDQNTVKVSQGSESFNLTYSLTNGNIIVPDPSGGSADSVFRLQARHEDYLSVLAEFGGGPFEPEDGLWTGTSLITDLAFLNNSAQALKDLVVDQGLWGSTVTEDGRIIHPLVTIQGTWWIENNIFYFAYPDEDTGCVDYKALKLENNILYRQTDAPYTIMTRWYFDPSEVPTTGYLLNGFWAAYHTEGGGAEGGPDYISLTQTGNNITGSWVCGDSITITGSVTDGNIALSWTEINANTVSLTGTISGSQMQGTWTDTGAGSGTWRAEKINEPVCETIKPTVISTAPANGETGVGRDLEWTSVTFSEPMRTDRSVSTTGSWPVDGSENRYWSDNGTVYHFSRTNAGTLLPANTTLSVILNPTDYLPGFKDISGNSLDTYTFTFTTGN